MSQRSVRQRRQGPKEIVVVACRDPSQSAEWGYALDEAGYRAELEADAADALERVRDPTPAVIVVPCEGRTDPVLASIRAYCDERLPIRFLTLVREGDDETCECCVAAGADAVADIDCLGRELAARIGALVRRSRARPAFDGDGVQEWLGDLLIDASTGTVRRGLHRVRLSSRQFKLLFTLLRSRGRAVSRSELYREVWGRSGPPKSRVIDACVMALRKKIESDPARPRWVLAVRSAGYMIP